MNLLYGGNKKGHGGHVGDDWQGVNRKPQSVV